MDRIDAWDAMCARRNVRRYEPQPVSDDDLNRIAEANSGSSMKDETVRRPAAVHIEQWTPVLFRLTILRDSSPSF
jgi:hypothetical protein